MLAYRHAFHAGNHADVLKHIVLMLVLRHMNAKPKPTASSTPMPAPAATRSKAATRRRRASTSAASAGSGPATDLPEIVADYVELVRRFNPDGVLAQYPGSPALAQMLLRAAGPAARLRAPSDRAEASCARPSAATPGRRWPTTATASPASRRSCRPRPGAPRVLMDPSYEGNGDYAQVVRHAARRAGALRRGRLHGLVSAGARSSRRRSCRGGSRRSRPKGWLHARLTVQQPDAQGFGLAGSGMFVINPPHSLAGAAAAGLLPWLVDVLGQYDGAHYALDRLDA